MSEGPSVTIKFHTFSKTKDRSQHLKNLRERNQSGPVSGDDHLNQVIREHIEFTKWISLVHVIVLYGEVLLGTYSYENHQVKDIFTMPEKIRTFLHSQMKVQHWQKITQWPYRRLRTFSFCRRSMGSVANYIHIMVFSPDPLNKYIINTPPPKINNIIWAQGAWRDFDTQRKMTTLVNWNEDFSLVLSLDEGKREYSVRVDT